MKFWIPLAIVTGLATSGGFVYLRGYPLELALASGVSIFALVIVAGLTLGRLRKELKTPVLEVERDRHPEDSDPENRNPEVRDPKDLDPGDAA